MAVVLMPKADKCKEVNAKSKSPNGQYRAILEIVGRIECGPTYFNLKMDDLNFGERIFGNEYLWSGDSVFWNDYSSD